MQHWTDVFKFLAALKQSDFTTGSAGIYVKTGTLYGSTLTISCLQIKPRRHNINPLGIH